MTCRLYSFRRCPYAIRARMALHIAQVPFETIEVDLKNKPPALLTLSPKGTVPVLQLADGRIIEESVDIVLWALSQAYPDSFLPRSAIDQQHADQLYALLHERFIPALNRYKYPNRYPESDPQLQHALLITVIEQLQKILQGGYYGGAQPCYLDILWFPFIRQFARIDQASFCTDAAGPLLDWFTWWETQEIMPQVMSRVA